MSRSSAHSAAEEPKLLPYCETKMQSIINIYKTQSSSPTIFNTQAQYGTPRYESCSYQFYINFYMGLKQK